MHKVRAVAGCVNMVACDIVHFPAGDSAAVLQCRVYGSEGRVTRPGNDFKHPLDPFRSAVTAEPGPGDVVVHGPGSVELGPEVDQHEVALANGL